MLNKEWDLGPLGKHSGWMGALLALGGKTAYDMASKYGLVDKAKDAADKAKDAVKDRAT